MQEIDRINEDISNCTLCHGHPIIAPLVQQGLFAYHWEPYWQSYGGLEYVFLGWEPSTRYVVEPWQPRTVGTFNASLNFAIQEYLSNSYLITNMAKCTMRTGQVCDDTREFRFKNCAPFLTRELSLVNAPAHRPKVVSIGRSSGRSPQWFIHHHPEIYANVFDGATIHCITHYSPQNEPRLRRFAAQDRAGYEQFQNSIREKYADWLKKSEHWGNDNPCEGEFFRMFKWRAEMEAIRNADT